MDDTGEEEHPTTEKIKKALSNITDDTKQALVAHILKALGMAHLPYIFLCGHGTFSPVITAVDQIRHHQEVASGEIFIKGGKVIYIDSLSLYGNDTPAHVYICILCNRKPADCLVSLLEYFFCKNALTFF